MNGITKEGFYMLKQRNIALCIIFSFLTCGIYQIYWFVCMVDELNLSAEEEGATSGIAVFLLSLVTCGIYQIYWYYKAGEKVNAARALRGQSADTNNSILYLILSIFGLAIVNDCLIQNELNQFAEM